VALPVQPIHLTLEQILPQWQGVVSGVFKSSDFSIFGG
jgi:hypothetical protein